MVTLPPEYDEDLKENSAAWLETKARLKRNLPRYRAVWSAFGRPAENDNVVINDEGVLCCDETNCGCQALTSFVPKELLVQPSPPSDDEASSSNSSGGSGSSGDSTCIAFDVSFQPSPTAGDGGNFPNDSQDVPSQYFDPAADIAESISRLSLAPPKEVVMNDESVGKPEQQTSRSGPFDQVESSVGNESRSSDWKDRHSFRSTEATSTKKPSPAMPVETERIRLPTGNIGDTYCNDSSPVSHQKSDEESSANDEFQIYDSESLSEAEPNVSDMRTTNFASSPRSSQWRKNTSSVLVDSDESSADEAPVYKKPVGKRGRIVVVDDSDEEEDRWESEDEYPREARQLMDKMEALSIRDTRSHSTSEDNFTTKMSENRGTECLVDSDDDKAEVLSTPEKEETTVDDNWEIDLEDTESEDDEKEDDSDQERESNRRRERTIKGNRVRKEKKKKTKARDSFLVDSDEDGNWDADNETNNSDFSVSDQDFSGHEEDSHGALEVSEEWPARSNHRSKQKYGKTTSMPKKQFKSMREELAQTLFRQFDEQVFNDALNEHTTVTWSSRLRTTAGVTRLLSRRDKKNGSVTRLAVVELSTKVLDEESRLEGTLMHELCHAAQWILDGVAKPPHGQCFKKWANQAMRNMPSIPVTVKHDYEIAFKFAWKCSNCGGTIRRHSRSVDSERQCCGRCRGKLIEINPTTGQVREARRPLSAYHQFIQANTAQVRVKLAQGQPSANVTQAEVLKECARLWKQQQQQ